VRTDPAREAEAQRRRARTRGALAAAGRWGSDDKEAGREYGIARAADFLVLTAVVYQLTHEDLTKVLADVLGRYR
jgi:hypothetical protein